MKKILQLVWMELQSSLRNKKLLTTLLMIVLVYGIFMGLNLRDYRQIAANSTGDPMYSIFMKVPLAEPIKTYSYFGNFTVLESGEENHGDLRTGFIFIPDRYEDPGIVTGMGRLFFLIAATIIILFAYNEFTQMKESGVYQSIIMAPLRRVELFRAKLLFGGVVSAGVFMLITILAVLLLQLQKLTLTQTQVQQIILYNLIYSVMLFLIYSIALAIGLTARDSGMALIKSLLAVVVIVYVIPLAVENLRNYVFFQLPRDWRAEWFWYSRYLYLGDLFGSFGDLGSELLFLERAQSFYLSLPWSHSLAQGEFTIGKLFLLSWFKFLTFVVWFIGVCIYGEGRLKERDVANIGRL